jgi:hypothetical protein
MGIGPANLNSRNMLARLSKSKYYQLVKPMARSINMARSIKETTRPHPGILQEAPDRRGQGAPCCSRAEGALDPASDSLAEMTATYPLANSRAARNATADPHIKSRWRVSRGSVGQSSSKRERTNPFWLSAPHNTRFRERPSRHETP